MRLINSFNFLLLLRCVCCDMYVSMCVCFFMHLFIFLCVKRLCRYFKLGFTFPLIYFLSHAQTLCSCKSLLTMFCYSFFNNYCYYFAYHSYRDKRENFIQAAPSIIEPSDGVLRKPDMFLNFDCPMISPGTA